MIERFADRDGGGFFQTSSDHEQLVARRKDLDDNPIPSGSSSAAYGLLRLAALTGEAALRGARRVGAAARRRVRAEPPAGLRAPAAGARLRSSRRCARSRSSATTRARSSVSCGRVSGRTSCWPAATDRRRTASLYLKVERRWAGEPPPMCASASAAGPRSPSRRSSRPCSSRPRDALETPSHGLCLRRRRRSPCQVDRRADLAARSSVARSARTSSASSPTPRRTSRPRSCRATRSRRRRSRSRRSSRAASSRRWSSSITATAA